QAIDLVWRFDIGGRVGMIAKLDVIIFPQASDPFEEARHPFELTIVERDRLVRPDPARDGPSYRRRNQCTDKEATLAQRPRKFSLADCRVIDPAFLIRVVESAVEKPGSRFHPVLLQDLAGGLGRGPI